MSKRNAYPNQEYICHHERNAPPTVNYEKINRHKPVYCKKRRQSPSINKDIDTKYEDYYRVRKGSAKKKTTSKQGYGRRSRSRKKSYVHLNVNEASPNRIYSFHDECYPADMHYPEDLHYPTEKYYRQNDSYFLPLDKYYTTDKQFRRDKHYLLNKCYPKNDNYRIDRCNEMPIRDNKNRKIILMKHPINKVKTLVLGRHINNNHHLQGDKLPKHNEKCKKHSSKHKSPHCRYSSSIGDKYQKKKFNGCHSCGQDQADGLISISRDIYLKENCECSCPYCCNNKIIVESRNNDDSLRSAANDNSITNSKLFINVNEIKKHFIQKTSPKITNSTKLNSMQTEIKKKFKKISQIDDHYEKQFDKIDNSFCKQNYPNIANSNIIQYLLEMQDSVQPEIVQDYVARENSRNFVKEYTEAEKPQSMLNHNNIRIKLTNKFNNSNKFVTYSTHSSTQSERPRLPPGLAYYYSNDTLVTEENSIKLKSIRKNYIKILWRKFIALFSFKKTKIKKNVQVQTVKKRKIKKKAINF